MHHSPVQLDPVSVVPPEIAPSEDLTARGRQVPESVEFVLCGEPQYAALFDRIARVLHRREQGNVILVGERGVGIGAMLGELARWGSQIPNHKTQITNKEEELSAFSSQLSAGSGDGGVDSRPRPGLRGQALRGNDGSPQPGPLVGGGQGGVDSRLRGNDGGGPLAGGAGQTVRAEPESRHEAATRKVPARQAGLTGPAFLRSKRFVEVNCRYTVPEESRGRLLALLASVAGQEELVVCIDGFASLLRGERGGTNKGALLSVMESWHGGQVQSEECRVKSEAGAFSSGATDNQQPTTDNDGGFSKRSQSPTRSLPFLPRIIGIMTPREYEELVADDADMLEHFARVDVPEPDVGTSIKLLRHFSKGLEQKYGIAIEPAAVELAVVLSANYILNEYLPGKALKILNRVCEGIDYERVFSFQFSVFSSGEAGATDNEQLTTDARNRVTPDDVLAAVAEASGVPESTLRGIAERSDYERSLSEEIVGQQHAVREVATELGLIKAGLTDPGKPASVMLFVGQTGTGKTEMAKVLSIPTAAL